MGKIKTVAPARRRSCPKRHCRSETPRPKRRETIARARAQEMGRALVLAQREAEFQQRWFPQRTPGLIHLVHATVTTLLWATSARYGPLVRAVAASLWHHTFATMEES